MKLTGIKAEDPVVGWITNRQRDGWAISEIKLEEKAKTGPREPRNILTIISVSPDGASLEHTYNYKKIQRSV